MILRVARLEHVKQVLQVGQRVRLKVAEEYNVVLVLKSVRECQCVQTDFHALL